MDHNFILVYEDVDPKIDLNAVHGAFLEAGMDISTLSGGLSNGYLALDITNYDDSALDGLLKAVSLGGKALGLGAGQLVEVAPDVVDRKEIGIRTGIATTNLQRYIKQSWFPNPVANGRCYKLDEAVIALQNNTRVEIEDAESLIETARAARLLNSTLAIKELSASDQQIQLHQEQAMAAIA